MAGAEAWRRNSETNKAGEMHINWRGRDVTKQALLAAWTSPACTQTCTHRCVQCWGIDETIMMIMYMFKHACESLLLLLLHGCLKCFYIWECGYTSGSHICPNQNNVSQIKIWSTAPATVSLSLSHSVSLQGLFHSFSSPPPFTPFLLSYLNTFFSLDLVVRSQVYTWEISPELYFSHEASRLSFRALRVRGQCECLYWGLLITVVLRC